MDARKRIQIIEHHVAAAQRLLTEFMGAKSVQSEHSMRNLICGLLRHLDDQELVQALREAVDEGSTSRTEKAETKSAIREHA